VPLSGLFVTGTDTEVGKTVVAATIAATLADQGHRVSVFKPVVTGLADADGPPDHERLRASARSDQAPADVAPYLFDPPLSPHLAAAQASVTVTPQSLRAAAHAAASGGDVLVAEGVGGLLVPLAEDYLVRDLIADLGLPVVIAARPGLGTINHTLLTIECARAAELDVAAVVLTPWPDSPAPMHVSNRDTIAALGDVDVTVLPQVDTVRAALAPRLELRARRWIESRYSPLAA
jgi:dethiobiotin synthetase